MSSRSLVEPPLVPAIRPYSFFSSLTLSAYRSVLRVFSQQEEAGETFAIMVVLLLPVKESFSTYVSLLPRNGVCFLSKSSALMHSFNARSDLLISAPSTRVCLSFSFVSAPRSEPAKSMKLILLWTRFVSFLSFSCNCKMACDLELSAFAPVQPL